MVSVGPPRGYELREETPLNLRACRYQLEALERAMSGNTVAFLDTGAGKTLIAGLLLRAYAHRVRKPARDFAVFLVPTRVLVEQQARVIEAHTDLRVSKFTGDMGVDFWNAAIWGRVVDDAEVLVMTPQILLDNLRHSFFSLQDIALLIFDECHRAKGNSPYACILKVPIVTTALSPFGFVNLTF